MSLEVCHTTPASSSAHWRVIVSMNQIGQFHFPSPICLFEPLYFIQICLLSPLIFVSVFHFFTSFVILYDIKKKICHPTSFNIFVLLAFMLWVSILSSLKVLVAQSRLTLCDPVDCSPPGSSVHEILQARILEWVAISYSNLMVYLLLEIRLDYEYYSRSVDSIFM